MPQRPSTEPFYSSSSSSDTGVLFVHGFTGSPASLREWAERTAAAGHRVSLPRLPGHGTRWQDLAGTTWQDWYATVDAELTGLRAHSERVFVAGLSMGGALALMLAQRRPDDVAGLALVNPALTAANPLLPFAGALKYLVRSTKGISNDAVREIDEGAYERTPTAAAAQLAALWGAVRPYLDLVQCPLLIFRSAEDHVVPPSSVAIIRRQVSSLDVTEHVLTRSYHVATMDHDAGFIVDTTLEFFARAGDEASG